MASESFETLMSHVNSSMPNVNIDPLKYPSVQCDECGCEYFVPAYAFKRLPGVLTGQGTEDTILPIPVYVCAKCGDLMPEYKEAKAKQDAKAQQSTTNLII